MHLYKFNINKIKFCTKYNIANNIIYYILDICIISLAYAALQGQLHNKPSRKGQY